MNNNNKKVRSWVIILSLVIALSTPYYVEAGQDTGYTAFSERNTFISKKANPSDDGEGSSELKQTKKESAEPQTESPGKESEAPGTPEPRQESSSSDKEESHEAESREEGSSPSEPETKDPQSESSEPETGTPSEEPVTREPEHETTESETGATESAEPETRESETPEQRESSVEEETPSEPEGSEDSEEEEREREREREKEKEREIQKESELNEESGETSKEDDMERETESGGSGEDHINPEDPLETETAEMEGEEGETETYNAEEDELEISEPIFEGSYEILDVVIPTEYRFIKIDKTPVILKNGAAIRADKTEESLLVGEARGDALAYLIEDGEGWAYIEAGYVRGFVKKSDLTEGNKAKKFYQRIVSWSREHIGQDVKSPFGRVLELLDHMDNPAFAYSRMTTMEVSAPKLYSIALEEVHVYDSESWVDLDILAKEGQAEKDPERENLHTVGILKPGDLAYILVSSETMLYVESGNVRGFVRKDALDTGDLVNQKVEAMGEYDMSLATEVMEPEKNRAFYYTVLSVIKAGTGLRESVVAFALQFVGNPYVWGGTSLTHGTDCSGFIQSVYRYFGYHLPRTSAAMRRYGVNVGTNLEDALPGDIICYNGHVSMYIGGGKIVHASNSASYPRGGIKVSKNGAYRQILTIRRVIK